MKSESTNIITGVADVYYNVSDRKRAVAFYKDVLGLKVDDQNDYRTSLDVGGVLVGLHWTEGEAIPPVLVIRIACALVFNRIVTLKDSWARDQKRQ